MYHIVSHPAGDYVTGKTSDNAQVLMGVLCPYMVSVVFDDTGTFNEVRVRPLAVDPAFTEQSGAILLDDPEVQDHLSQKLSEWQRETAFTETSIHVERFFVKEFAIGIEELPRHLRDFTRTPADFSDEERLHFPRIISEWKSDGCFVLWWGTDYYLSRQGEIT